MKSKKILIFFLLLLFASSMALSGCASMSGTTSSTTSSSGLSAGNMTLSTKMSASIFLQPVQPQGKVVYVTTRNTSSATGLNFRNELISTLMGEGYRITNNPQEANFMLMSNILYIGKETHRYTMEGALVGGFGGAVIGSYSGHAFAGGLIGATAGAIVGSLYQQKYYMMVVDIQLEQRQAGTYTTNGTTTSEGLGNTTTTYNSGVKNWAIYRDRIVSQATAINLRFSSAEPALKHEMSHEIANLMP